MKLSLAIVLCGLLLACTLSACFKKFTRIEGGQICPADGACLPLDARHAVAISLKGTDLQLMSLPADSLLPVGTGISPLSRTLLAEGRAKSVKATLIQVRDGDLLFLGPDQQEIARVAQDALLERRVVFFANPDGLIISTTWDTIGIGGIIDDCEARRHQEITLPDAFVEGNLVYIATPRTLSKSDYAAICVNTSVNSGGAYVHVPGIGVVVQVDDNILPPDWNVRGNWRLLFDHDLVVSIRPTDYTRLFAIDVLQEKTAIASHHLLGADLSKLSKIALNSTSKPECKVKFDVPKPVLRLPMGYDYSRCGRTFYVKEGEKELWSYSLESECTEGHFWFVEGGCITVYSNLECPELTPPAYLTCP